MKKANQPTNQVKSKRPAKPAKASGKVETAPAKVRRLGGASAARMSLSSSEQAWHDDWLEKFEERLAVAQGSAKDKNERRKKYLPKLTKWIVRMRSLRVEAKAKLKGFSKTEDLIMQAYDRGIRDGFALAEAQAGLEKFKASQQGLDAARVQLIGLESGADIASEVVAKHISPPEDEGKERINALSEAGLEIDGALTRPVHSIETHGELALALEALGEWLSEVEKVTGKGKPKARWRRILDPQGAIFSTKKRRIGDATRDRYFITKQDAMRLKGGIRKAVKAAQKAGDEGKNLFMAPILEALEKYPSACVDFLTAYYQRNTGARGDVIARKAALAEAIANNNEQPRKVGQSKEQARKTLENDLAWIRSQKRSH